MGLVLGCMVRILHDDRSIRLGQNRPDRVLKHLVAMLLQRDLMQAVTMIIYSNVTLVCAEIQLCWVNYIDATCQRINASAYMSATPLVH